MELRYLDVPLEVRWARVRDRGMEQRLGTGALTHQNLVEYDEMFEPPTDAELALYDPPST